MAQFVHFPQFPTEIRLKIWELAFHNRSGRLIEVRTNSVQHRYVNRPAWPYRYSPVHLPAIFHACHESREVAQASASKSGQFLFGTVLFDPAIDTLYVPQEPERWDPLKPSLRFQHLDTLTQLAQVPQARQIRFLAVQADLIWTRALFQADEIVQLGCEVLEEITFVDRDVQQDAHEDYVYRFRSSWEGLSVVRDRMRARAANKGLAPNQLGDTELLAGVEVMEQRMRERLAFSWETISPIPESWRRLRLSVMSLSELKRRKG